MKLRTKFQDENFELGEVVNAFCHGEADRIRVNAYANDNKYGESYNYYYNSIKDFTDHWEDAPEEPKGKALNWMILTLEDFIENEPDDKWVDLEDCKQMLEKLKAWQRLKDKGFRFDGWKRDERYWGDYTITATDQISCDYEDLDVCFGGEE